MKRIMKGFIAVVLALLIAPCATPGPLVSIITTTNLTFQVSGVDTFHRANASFTTPWTVTTGFASNFEVSANTAIVSALGSDDNYNYTAIAPPGTQWVGVLLTATGTGAENDGYGVSVGTSASANTFTRVTCNQTGYEVFQNVSGTGTSLSSATTTTCPAGTFLSLSMANGQITAYRNWKPFYSVTNSLITQGQLGISYSSTDNGGAIGEWVGGTFNVGGLYTPPASGMVFPDIGIQANYGAQTVANSTILKQLAQYQYVMWGGNFSNYPSALSSASGGTYTTRDQIFNTTTGLKSFTASGGKNAVTPYIAQYDNLLDYVLATPAFPEWAAAVAGNNWYLYEAGASGTKTPSIDGSGWVTVDPAHAVGTDHYAGTGLYPMGYAAYLLYQRYFVGSVTGGAANASTHIDAYFMDNQPPQNLFGGPADPQRTGTTSSYPTNTTNPDTTATAIGKANAPAELAAISTIPYIGNSNFGYDLSSSSTGGLGMSPNATSGVFALAEQQFMYGTTAANGGNNNVLDFGGFAGFMSWYQTLDANVKTGGRSILTGCFTTTDYQRLRYSLGATLMRNGIFVVGSATYFAGELYACDTVSPTDTTSFPVYDEFWGGTKSLGGYMGTVGSGARGAIQTAPWSAGVWERNFQYCAVFVNPNTNSAQTLNPTTLGYPNLYYLHGLQDPVHNPGGSTPVTSFTLQPSDSQILCTTPSTSLLPAANDDFFHQRINGTFKEAA